MKGYKTVGSTKMMQSQMYQKKKEYPKFWQEQKKNNFKKPALGANAEKRVFCVGTAAELREDVP
ncbi:MAG: hypothetical protein LUH47_08140 [Clostridiales bacterium]|nr:hypothetical protein [Clostridiales bacterium]